MLRTRNGVGRFIYPHLQPGQQATREDLHVFIPHEGEPDWLLTIEGSPDEPARCFIVKDRDELRKLIQALEMALDDVES